MKLLNCLSLTALLFLFSACSTVPFKATELTPVVPISGAELCKKSWTTASGSLLIRQSALFEFQGVKIPIAGIMKFNLAAKSARLVGMNDMGVKLYDISVERTSSKANFIIPHLASYPGFSEAVAVSVRRIFLEPEPSPDDSLKLSSNKYLLTRENKEGKLSFQFGGTQAQLLEKTFLSKAESWKVRYFQYQEGPGGLLPGGIILDDDRAGYRLTLWIESVEKTDE